MLHNCSSSVTWLQLLSGSLKVGKRNAPETTFSWQQQLCKTLTMHKTSPSMATSCVGRLLNLCVHPLWYKHKDRECTHSQRNSSAPQRQNMLLAKMTSWMIQARSYQFRSKKWTKAFSSSMEKGGRPDYVPERWVFGLGFQLTKTHLPKTRF